MSLIAHYPLTNDFKDYSGNNRHLDNNGLTLADGGKFGKSPIFTGTNYCNRQEDYLSSILSFSVWAKADNTTEDMAVVKLNMSAIGMGYIQNRFRFWIWDGVSGTNNNEASFEETEVGVWNHFVGVYDGKTLKVYKNGVLKASKDCIMKPRTEGGKFFTIGCREDVTYPFKGSITDVRVYDHALSIKEIKELSKGKLLHYKFDDYQEPTTNLVPSPLVFSTGWESYDNGNDGHFMTDLGTEGIRVVDRKSWCGVSKVIKLPAPGTYTISVYTKVHKVTTSAVRPTLYTTGGGLGDQVVAANNTRIGEWQRLQMTRTYTTTDIRLYLICYGGDRVDTNRISAEYTMPQIEQKPYMTPFVNGSRTGKINDCSGFNNDSLALEEATTPRWIDGYYSFTKGNLIKHPNPFLGQNNLLQEWTVCAWVNIDTECGTYAGLNSFNLSNRFTQETTPLLYLNNGTNDYYTYGKLLPKDKWIHVAYVFRNRDGLRKIYCNGEDYSTSGPNMTSLPAGLKDIILIGENFTGLLDDYRVYATALDKDSIKDIYLCKTSIDKSGKVFTNSISVPENGFLKMDKAIQAKEYKDGLTSYEQANCKCTLTDDGYRIFRGPNLNYPEIGNTVWGGLRLILPGETIKPDRKYKLLFDYKGQSSNHFDIYFARQIGWTTQGGLKGLYPQASKNLPKDNHNSTEWQTAEISFKYSRSDIYQVATKSEGICTQGETYNCASEFKIGYGYTSTGALGTDMYIKNIRLYDITDGDVTVDKSGIKASAINEIGVVRDLIAYYPFDKDSKDYSGYKHHLDGTYVSTDGIKNQAIKIDGMASGIKTKLAFPASGTVSAWGKTTMGTAGQMLFSFDTDVYGPDLYFAHDVISWNIGDGGTNAFMKDGVAQGYPSNNVWHHYVVVMDAVKNKVTLYIDGEYCGDAKYISPEQPNTKNFIIGSSETLTAYIWKGDVDNVKVSTACWSPQEVKIEYETTANKKVLINKDGTIYAGSFDEVSI